MSEARDPKANAGPFSAMAVTWMILIGVVAALALALLGAFAPELRRGDNGGGHVYSHSGVGFAALARIIDVAYGPPIILRGPRDNRAAVVIFTPGEQHRLDDIRQVKADGPKLVILPKWRTRPNPTRPQWVTADGVVPTAQLDRAFLEPLVPGAVLKRGSDRHGTPDLRFTGGSAMRGAPIMRLQTFTGDGWRPVVTDGQGGVILGCKGEFCVLSDPDFMNTQGLDTLPAARVALAMIAAIAEPGPAVIDVTLHNFGDRPNLLRLLFQPALLGPTLCLLALAVLLIAHAVVRFGPPLAAQRAIALGKAALADNTAALVRRASREHRMLLRYALVQRDAVAAGVGAPKNLDDDDLSGLLDRLSDAAGAARFSGLLDRARAAGPKSDLQAIAGDLFQWRTEMMRER